jgi:hypothetical protein
MIKPQNLRTLVPTILAFLFLACGSSNTDKQLNSTGLKQPHLRIDTTFAPSSKIKKLSYWADYSDFFSVYKIDDQVFGIAIDLSPDAQEDPLQSLLNRYLPENSLLKDGGIYKHPSLTQKILNRGPEKFYVYCEKGRSECQIDSVWYQYSECTASLILTLARPDTLRYGKPLIASKKKLDLVYQSLAGFDQALHAYEEVINKQIDFPDTDIHAVQFAHNKEYVFTYKGPGINAPGRAIFRMGNKHLKCTWASYLDIIGISCI